MTRLPWSELRMLEAGGGGLVEETIVNNKVVGMEEQVEDGKRQQVSIGGGSNAIFMLRGDELWVVLVVREVTRPQNIFYTTVGLMHILDFKAPLQKRKVARKYSSSLRC